MTEDPISRGEFDLLARQVNDQGRRLEAAALPGIAVQLAEVIKDVGAVERGLADHRHEHERQAELADRAKRDAHRWRIGTLITASASWAAVMGVLLAVLAHVH